MLCENLVQTENQELNLSITVRTADLNSPRTEQQLRDELLAHALDCHECLAAVLFGDESLAESGCQNYRELFSEATEELALQQPIDPEAHITEPLMEAFFFDCLGEEQLAAMAEHVEHCASCHQHLQSRQAFYLSVKAAVLDQKTGHSEHRDLSGILGVSMPEAGLAFCSRLNENRI